MSEKKYTPGPWHVVKNYDEDFVGVGKTVPWTCLGIADMFDNGDGIETREANARLIACAPELLEALEESLMWHQGDKWGYGTSEQRVIWEDWKTKLEHLIAKAKGSDALAIPKE